MAGTEERQPLIRQTGAPVSSAPGYYSTDSGPTNQIPSERPFYYFLLFSWCEKRNRSDFSKDHFRNSSFSFAYHNTRGCATSQNSVATVLRCGCYKIKPLGSNFYERGYMYMEMRCDTEMKHRRRLTFNSLPFFIGLHWGLVWNVDNMCINVLWKYELCHEFDVEVIIYELWNCVLIDWLIDFYLSHNQ